MDNPEDQWSTPQKLFDQLDAEFHFTLDPCASAENAKCAKFYTYDDGGVSKNWGVERVFMNPPYSSPKLTFWMKKAYTASLAGALVVCLVPASTDTNWFHTYALRGEIRFIRGRLKFGGSKNSAKFASLIVIFRPPQVIAETPTGS
jgi:phage N-6-adenine-methyltransferase